MKNYLDAAGRYSLHEQQRVLDRLRAKLDYDIVEFISHETMTDTQLSNTITDLENDVDDLQLAYRAHIQHIESLRGTLTKSPSILQSHFGPSHPTIVK